MNALKTYLWRISSALSCVVNALVGGYPNETLSSRAYRMEHWGKPWGRYTRPALDWLFAWQKASGGHCRNSWRNTVRRLNLPPELR